MKMNEEEIQKALKIVKEPITVNSIEYKYFDQENYEKLLTVYENCLWFINNAEQFMQNLKNLQEENCKLRETNEEHRKINGQLRKENDILRENAEHNDKVVDKVNWENQKLVKVIEEIKFVFDNPENSFSDGCDCREIEDILNKLTKLKGGKDA